LTQQSVSVLFAFTFVDSDEHAIADYIDYFKVE
jgi:hypothetical protein